MSAYVHLLLDDKSPSNSLGLREGEAAAGGVLISHELNDPFCSYWPRIPEGEVSAALCTHQHIAKVQQLLLDAHVGILGSPCHLAHAQRHIQPGDVLPLPHLAHCRGLGIQTLLQPETQLALTLIQLTQPSHAGWRDLWVFIQSS